MVNTISMSYVICAITSANSAIESRFSQLPQLLFLTGGMKY